MADDLSSSQKSSPTGSFSRLTNSANLCFVNSSLQMLAAVTTDEMRLAPSVIHDTLKALRKLQTERLDTSETRELIKKANAGRDTIVSEVYQRFPDQFPPGKPADPVSWLEGLSIVYPKLSDRLQLQLKDAKCCPSCRAPFQAHTHNRITLPASLPSVQASLDHMFRERSIPLTAEERQAAKKCRQCDSNLDTSYLALRRFGWEFYGPSILLVDHREATQEVKAAEGRTLSEMPDAIILKPPGQPTRVYRRAAAIIFQDRLEQGPGHCAAVCEHREDPTHRPAHITTLLFDDGVYAGPASPQQIIDAGRPVLVAYQLGDCDTDYGAQKPMTYTLPAHPNYNTAHHSSSQPSISDQLLRPRPLSLEQTSEITRRFELDVTDPVDQLPLPQHLRSYSISIIHRGSDPRQRKFPPGWAFAPKGPDEDENDEPLDVARLKRTFDTNNVYLRNPPRHTNILCEAVLEFPTLNKALAAYSYLTDQLAANMDWPLPVDFRFARMQIEAGGLKGNEIPGRLVIEPIRSALQDEEIKQLISAAVRRSLNLGEEMDLRPYCEIDIHVTQQLKRKGCRTAFLIMRSDRLAEQIIRTRFHSDLQTRLNQTLPIRVNGTSHLELCYLCFNRGHNSSDCKLHCIRVERRTRMPATFREFLRSTTGAKLVTPGNSHKQYGPPKTWAHLIFDSKEQRTRALPAVAKLYKAGYFSKSPSLSEGFAKCCADCGSLEHERTADTCIVRCHQQPVDALKNITAALSKKPNMYYTSQGMKQNMNLQPHLVHPPSRDTSTSERKQKDLLDIEDRPYKMQRLEGAEHKAYTTTKTASKKRPSPHTPTFPSTPTNPPTQSEIDMKHAPTSPNQDYFPSLKTATSSCNPTTLPPSLLSSNISYPPPPAQHNHIPKPATGPPSSTPNPPTTDSYVPSTSSPPITPFERSPIANPLAITPSTIPSPRKPPAVETPTNTPAQATSTPPTLTEPTTATASSLSQPATLSPNPFPAPSPFIPPATPLPNPFPAPSPFIPVFPYRDAAKSRIPVPRHSASITPTPTSTSPKPLSSPSSSPSPPTRGQTMYAAALQQIQPPNARSGRHTAKAPENNTCSKRS